MVFLSHVLVHVLRAGAEAVRDTKLEEVAIGSHV